MGWLDGLSDSGGDSNTWNMNDWFGGSSGNSNNDWNMNDWWSSNDPYSSSSDWLDNSGNYSYFGNDASTGSSGGMNWGSLLSGAGSFLNSPLGGALLAGGASWLSNKEAFQNAQDMLKLQSQLSHQNAQDMLKLQSQLSQQNYAANKATDEQYYQSHGKQLSDALGGYAKYYRDPSLAQNNPTNIFGLLTPKPTTGPLANGW